TPQVIPSTGGNSHAGPGGQRPSCRTAKKITGPADGDAAAGPERKFLSTAPNGESSGRSVFKQPVNPSDSKSGYKEGGMDAKAYDVTGIDTRIRYDSSRNPPFTVMTSMPYKP
ncbi:hypothetical protein ABZ920_12355, partial [Streptomyces sp. NPDC046831]|uniref:hypothetical protein n=1 Tax=Streptomyces sp. NPDC046831 TaxID=3154805 RepID=UPI0033E355C2